MAVYKKPLYDKDGNQIYPDVGLELDEVIYGDDPGQVETPSPWIETGDIKDNQITSAKIADGAITASKVDWSTVFERQTFTVTLDSTGNAELGVNTADYWILSVSQIGSGSFVNGNAVPYSWSNGKYYIHVDQNYGHAYSTGAITVEVLLLKRSVIGF